MKKNQTRKMIYIAVLTGLSVVLMFFEFPIPFFPPFLKFDLSDAVVFTSSFIVGPLAMFVIIILRSLLHWLLKGAEVGIPVGQLASILSSTSFCFVAYFTFKKLTIFKKENTRLAIGLVLGMSVMSIVMFIANYFWITPFYFALGNMPLPENYFTYLLIYIPFNLLKGLFNSSLIFIFIPAVNKLLQHTKNQA